MLKDKHLFYKNPPAKPFIITKQSKGKKHGYTHCDPHHILYPSASSRPQLQNFKPAAEKYKWEQFSCPIPVVRSWESYTSQIVNDVEWTD